MDLGTVWQNGFETKHGWGNNVGLLPLSIRFLFIRENHSWKHNVFNVFGRSGGWKWGWDGDSGGSRSRFQQIRTPPSTQGSEMTSISETPRKSTMTWLGAHTGTILRRISVRAIFM